MPRATLAFFVVVVIVGGARSASTASDTQAAPSPAVVGEANVAAQLYRVTPSGALVALERVKEKDKKVGGTHSHGVFKPSTQDYNIYVEGPASPVIFAGGDPQVLAVRLLDPGDRWGREATPEELARHLLLTRLRVQDGRRFLTELNVPVDPHPYGVPGPGLDPKNPNRRAGSFQITPRQPLPAGEYVILLAGTHDGELVGNMLAGRETFAFAVAAR